MGKLLRRGKEGENTHGGGAPARMNAPKKDLTVGKERKLRYTYAQVQQALAKKKGMVTHAARLLGTSYKNLNDYIQANPKLQAFVKEQIERRIDDAEMILDNMMYEGDKTAVIFFLKTIGKHRGYIEDGKVDPTKMNQPITFIYQEAPRKE